MEQLRHPNTIEYKGCYLKDNTAWVSGVWQSCQGNHFPPPLHQAASIFLSTLSFFSSLTLTLSHNLAHSLSLSVSPFSTFPIFVSLSSLFCIVSLILCLSPFVSFSKTSLLQHGLCHDLLKYAPTTSSVKVVRKISLHLTALSLIFSFHHLCYDGNK